MNISLPCEFDELVREKVERGDYESPDAFVLEAVQRLINEELDENAHLDEIRLRIEAAEGQIDRGEFVQYDEDTIHDLAKQVHERSLKRLLAERDQTGTRG